MQSPWVLSSLTYREGGEDSARGTAGSIDLRRKAYNSINTFDQLRRLRAQDKAHAIGLHRRRTDHRLFGARRNKFTSEVADLVADLLSREGGYCQRPVRPRRKQIRQGFRSFIPCSSLAIKATNQDFPRSPAALHFPKPPQAPESFRGYLQCERSPNPGTGSMPRLDFLRYQPNAS